MVNIKDQPFDFYVCVWGVGGGGGGERGGGDGLQNSLKKNSMTEFCPKKKMHHTH